jgi:hypothetical protein
MPSISFAPSTVLLTEILPFMHKILSPSVPAFRDSAVMTKFFPAKNPPSLPLSSSLPPSSHNSNPNSNFNYNNNNNNNTNNSYKSTLQNTFTRNTQSFNDNNSNTNFNSNNNNTNFNNTNFNNTSNKTNQNVISPSLQLPPTTQADYESFLSGPSYNLLTSLCTYVSTGNAGNLWDRASKLETWFIPDDERQQEIEKEVAKLSDDIEEF